jgi:hypothetical protein
MRIVTLIGNIGLILFLGGIMIGYVALITLFPLILHSS